MSKLGVLEDTLFVPMLGRIYASEYCPQILYDPKALELKKKLPSDLLGKGGNVLRQPQRDQLGLDSRLLRGEERGRFAGSWDMSTDP